MQRGTSIIENSITIQAGKTYIHSINGEIKTKQTLKSGIREKKSCYWMDIINKTTQKKPLGFFTYYVVIVLNNVCLWSIVSTTITQFNWFVLFSICYVQSLLRPHKRWLIIFCQHIKIDWLIADFDFLLFDYTFVHRHNEQRDADMGDRNHLVRDGSIEFSSFFAP